MCGISGIAGFKDISKQLYNSIRSLEYRGYDSCGMAVINGMDKKIQVKKNIGTVDEVNEKELFAGIKGHIGIAHTRWATHGKVTKENTHPHLSCDGNFALVHNGIISNYNALKTILVKEGHIFKSETDTEVIVHLIEKHYKAFNDVEKAMMKTISELEGTFAFALLTVHDKDKIFCAKSESPLIIGISDDCKFIGSDFNAFIEFTKNAIILDDGEYAIVTKDNFIIKDYVTGETKDKEITKIEWDHEMSKKGGYPHYMLKEIHEQPQTITSAINVDGISEVTDILANSNSVYITGVGTTYYVALFAQYMFRELSGKFFSSISADEFTNLAELDKNTTVIALSQSGETYDTLTAIKHAKKKEAKTIGIVNVIGSSIARLVDKAVMQSSGPEICVISTKAAIAQMIILTRVALELGVLKGHITKDKKEEIERDIHSLPNIIRDFLNERSGFIHTLAKKYASRHNWLYLGRGIYYPVALESALKMKEVSYVHAEAMPCGFLKHGTIAMIDENLVTAIFVPPVEAKEIHALTMGSIEEIKARNGLVVGIHFGDLHSQKNKLFDDEILLPKVPVIIAPFLQLISAQLFAYFTATILKRNVDKPRSLAKSVTVA